MLIKQTTQMTDSERIATENSNNQFLQSLSFVAVGTIYPFAGSTIPDTFMLCDGSALDTTEYSELFSVIGYTYGGSGDSFNIPDLRGKVLVGCDSSDTSFNALGKKGGAKEVTLTVAQMPEHEGHLYQNGTDIEAVLPPIGNLAGFLNESTMTAYPSSGRGWNLVAGNEVVPAGVSRGGDQPHENMPPYMVCNYIIKVNQGISTDDFRLPIDQTYTPTSPNAQSGLATAEAVGVANDYTDKAIKSLKTYANTTFANALKGSKSGSAILIDDVSPVTHEMTVKVSSDTVTDLTAVKVSRYGKNLFNILFFENKKCNGLVCAKEQDDTYSVKGNCSERFGYFADYDCFIPKGTTITVSSKFDTNLTKDTSIGFGVVLRNISGVAIVQQNTYREPNITTITLTEDIYKIGMVWRSVNSVVGDYIEFTNIQIQLEVGSTATEYEPYIAPTEYTPNADGTVNGVTSLYPNTTLMTDTEGVIIDCEYNRYIIKAFAALEAAIATNNR